MKKRIIEKRKIESAPRFNPRQSDPREPRFPLACPAARGTMRKALSAALSLIWISVALAAPKAASPAAGRAWDEPKAIPRLPIGMNMPELNYYDPAIAFTDAMTTASDLLTAYDDDPWDTGRIAEIKRDENGYPLGLPQRTSDGKNTFVRFLVSDVYSGRYRIDFEGSGTLGGCVEEEDGTYYIEFDGTGEPRWIDILTSSKSDPVRGMRILPEGILDAASAPVFLDAFVEGLRPFHAIRFMDWTRTNNSTQVEWKGRVTKGYYTQGSERGVSWDYAVALCNELGADAWVNVPHMASDDYIAKMAALWRDGLKPGLKVYLEYSNELWNWPFSQSTWVDENARGAANPYVSKDLAALGAKGMGFPEKDAYMMGRAFRIWGEAFKGREDRVINVATGQAAWADNSERILDYLKNVARSPVEALAVGGYFSFYEADHKKWMAKPSSATPDAICDAVLDGMASNSDSWARRSAAFAKKYGVQFLVYEGGQHMQPFNQEEWPYNDRLYAAQIHPKMYRLYLKNFAVHAEPAVDCRLFMAYNYIGPRESQFGSWGHLESLDDVGTAYSSIAPKYQALLDCNTPKDE
jgi:hypothetical protein